mmetsp:Transcript_11640/g.14094  ORF Transcript_11640/g.14094 Transcript_11640/m.14094 type:complete len:279 (+) Transcript_11640:2209-3045(+)
MVFQPVIPLSGFGGWSFLQATYDRQLEAFNNSPQIKNDAEYLKEKLSEPMSVEDFLGDQRLRRISLTSFGLDGEDWKVGFHRKVLDEVQDPESSFLTRLNNPQYTRFAEGLNPINGTIALSSSQVDQIAARFVAESFEVAVGEQDNGMRLSLNYQDEINELVTENSTDETILFRLLGSVPVRTVLESALGIPTATQQLPIERQSEILNERLKSQFNLNSVQDLKDPETVERVVQRYQALQGLTQNAAAFSPASTALVLLGNAVGFGSVASQNLFLSSF